MRRQRGERGARARACTRVWHPKDGGGQGKSAPPPSAAGPPGPEPPGCPPATAGGRRRETRGGLRGTPPPPFPPSPPSPPPTRGRPEAGQGGGGPAPLPRGSRHPGGGRHSRGERSRKPSAPSRPPTPSRSARCQPAALRRRSRVPRGPQRDGDTQECSMEGRAQTKRPALVPAQRRRGNRPRQRDLPAAHPAGPSGRAPGYGAVAAPPPPPPRQADQPTAGRAAPGVRGCLATPAEHIYPGGVRRRRRGSGPGALGHPPRAEGWGTTARPRLPSPPHSPLRPADHRGAGLPPSLRQRGRPPSPGRGRGARGERQLSPHAARPQAHLRLLPRGLRQAGEPARAHKDDTRTTPGGGTRTRTGAVWGPRPP